MASLAQPDHFRLQFDSYRLTDDRLNYYVLCAILLGSVSHGRRDTNKISIENLQVQVAELEQSEAKAYGLNASEVPSCDAIWMELSDLGARDVIDFDIPTEGHIVATPLIDKWPEMESVRRDREGKLLRRQI